MGWILDRKQFSLAGYHLSFGLLMGCLIVAMSCCFLIKKD